MSYKILLTTITSLIISSSSWSASFIYASFEKQLRDSDAAVSGEVLNSKVVKSSDGQVYTNYTLSLKQYSGINDNAIFHKNSFSFSVLGGDWQGIRYQISGAPSFKTGEHVFLVLKKTNGFFTPQNLGLSKYNFQTIDGKEVLTSSVFPNHPELGKINMEKVQKSLEKRFGKVVNLHENSFGEKANGPIVHTYSQTQLKRAPASQVEDPSKPKLGMIWLVMLLAGLACLKYVLKLGR